MSMRLIFRTITLFLWAAAAAMPLHRSQNPSLMGRYSTEYALLMAVAVFGAALFTLVQVPAVYSRIYRYRHGLLWVFVMCPVLLFAAGEVFTRAIEFFGTPLYGEILRYMKVAVADDYLVYKSPADHRGTYQGVEVTTNELGLRERHIASKPPDRHRVLVLGDSVTFGWGVRVEDTFCRRLEREFRFDPAVPVETINAGVPGYNTYQEMKFLERYGESLAPDAVLLLYVDNDVDVAVSARSLNYRPSLWKDPAGAIDYTLTGSRFYFLLRLLGPALVAAAIGKGRETEGPTSPGWRASMESLATIASYCRQREIPFAAFEYRMRANEKGDALYAGISQVAQRERFLFSDTLPWFHGQNIRRLINSFVDSHPNAEGHRILADGIRRYLIENGVRPRPEGHRGAPAGSGSLQKVTGRI